MGDFLGNVGGFFNMIGGLFVPGGEENVDGSMRPRVPRLDVVIHADVVQGRGLLPRDLSGHPENWSVDPLVQVQVRRAAPLLAFALLCSLPRSRGPQEAHAAAPAPRGRRARHGSALTRCAARCR